ncbi:MAG: hypothetical protein ACRCXM_08785 [Beijerinckiaceae bacterium]
MQHWRTVLFVGVMGFSSAVTIVKLALLAIILSKSDFTLYTSIFMAAVFGSSLVSAGAVERAVKLFIRMLAEGDRERTRALYRRIGFSLFWRHALLLAIAWAGLAVVGRTDLGLPVTAAILISLATTLFGLTASLFRGLDLLMPLAGITLARTAGVAVVALVAAWMSGRWTVVLFAETLALIAIASGTVLWLDRAIAVQGPAMGPGDGGAPEQTEGARDQFYLFLAFLALTAPPNLDRAIVTLGAPAAEAALYALLAIWISGAYAFSGIYIQKSGPDLIRQHAISAAGVAGSAWRQLLLVATLNAGFAVAAFAFTYSFFHESVFMKYELTVSARAATVIAAALQGTPLLDWALIAQDRERQLLLASLVFVLAWAIAVAVALLAGWGALGCVAAFIGARLAQIAVQAASLHRK